MTTQQSLSLSFKEMEMTEWVQLNRNLRQHGLPAIMLASGTGQNSDLLVLSPEASNILRRTIQTLIRDTDRRQELIQELIVTNNQLRDELKCQATFSETVETRARGLRTMLDESRFKLKEVEDEQLNSSSIMEEEEEKLRNTKEAAQARCTQLRRRCDMYQQEIDRLKNKIQRMNEDEEMRQRRQKEVFDSIKRKATRGRPVDDGMLDMIDSYERQIHQLKRELSLSANGDSAVSSGLADLDVSGASTTGATANYKALVKSYERKERENKKKINSLENENELLKLDMESRPTLKDLRDSQTRVKKLEMILKRHGLGSTQMKKDDKRSFSTRVEDLEFLPQSHCRNFLKAICDELEIYDVTHVVCEIQKRAQCRGASGRLEQFAKDVLTLVESPDTPRPREAMERPRGGKPHAMWCEKTWHGVLHTIEYWVLQLQALKELEQSLTSLVKTVFPWKTVPHSPEPTTIQLINLVDSLTAEDAAEVSGSNGRGGKKEEPTKAMLLGYVTHFQQLFDTPRLSGVYTTMNDVYRRLGEVDNLMKAIKDLMGLPPGCHSGHVVEAVADICSTHRNLASDQMKQLLHTEDLDSIVQRLDEHQRFFPAFQQLLHQVMDTLGVDRVDQVVPAVNALKLLAGT